MQHGVLVTADIRSHRQPLFGDVLLERHVIVTDARIAEEVPGVIEEVVRHIGLAPAGLATLWARDAIPLFVTRQWRDTGIVRLEVLYERQDYRQILLRHRYCPAVVTVDDRYRRTPVPLTRDAPIVQPVVDHWLGGAGFRQELYDRLLGRLDIVAIEDTRIHQRSRFTLGECFIKRSVRVFALAANDANDRQIELRRELEVALIVAGNAHNGTRSVLHQHVIGDPDGNLLLRRR